MKKRLHWQPIFGAILPIYFSNSLTLLLSLARTHALTHTSLSAWTALLWIISFSYGTALMVQRARVMPIPLSFWRAHRMRPCVRLPACACFCMLPAFSRASLILPCLSIKRTCRWKRDFLHWSLLWRSCRCRYRRSSTGSAQICSICALFRSQHEAFTVCMATVAPSTTPHSHPHRGSSACSISSFVKHRWIYS